MVWSVRGREIRSLALHLARRPQRHRAPGLDRQSREHASKTRKYNGRYVSAAASSRQLQILARADRSNDFSDAFVRLF